MKRKGFTFSLAVMFMLAFSITGTLAYISTNTKDIVNEFEIIEVPNDIIADDFSDDAAIKTNVRIKNTSTDKDAYIRATVVANWVEVDEYGELTNAVWGMAPKEGVDYDIIWGTSGWEEYPANSGVRYYTDKVSAGSETAMLFTSCSELASGNKPSGYKLTIEVLSQSIQADGLDSKGNKPVELAWGVDIINNNVVAATIE